MSFVTLGFNYLEVRQLTRSVDLQWRPFLDIHHNIKGHLNYELYFHSKSDPNGNSMAINPRYIDSLLKDTLLVIDGISLKFMDTLTGKNVGTTPALMKQFNFGYFLWDEWNASPEFELKKLYDTLLDLPTDLVARKGDSIAISAVTIEHRMTGEKLKSMVYDNEVDTLYISGVVQYEDFFGHQYDAVQVIYFPLKLVINSGKLSFPPTIRYAIQRYRWDYLKKQSNSLNRMVD